MDPEAGSVQTFLIADVRGYTRHASEQGDPAAGALTTRFAAIVREVVEARDGVVVEFRGDEALCAFASPRAALASAVRLQAAFATETFDRENGAALPVGVGLDAGEVVATDEGLRGSALNRAARLCGLAAAGEVLATAETVHLAGPVDGLSYNDKGSLRLKGFGDPANVVRVVASDADPAIRYASLDTAPSPRPSARRLRVVLADDAILFREGVASLLSEAGLEVVGQVGNGDGLVQAARSTTPDVVITDIRMPPTGTTEGLVAARRIREELPDVGVLVLSQYVEPRQAVDLLREHTERIGYLLKDRVSDVPAFVETVSRVARGGSAIDPEVVAALLGRAREPSALEELSERERKILGLMAEGRSNQAIAERLFVSPKTVEAHVAHVFTKLGLVQTPDDHRRVLAVVMYLGEQ
jgi:DNA-binding NarL/FixJ family response regulator/class 3 adenylate cyclase